MPPSLHSAQKYSAYKQAELTVNKSKEELLLMLYDGALKFLRFARAAITKQHVATRGENLSKVLAILAELDCALDHDLGGELSANLSSLYQYMITRVTQANIQNDLQALDEVVHLLSELQEGFVSSIQVMAASPSPSHAPQDAVAPAQ
jgi:flagellar protein FliS